jgi:hypothetical protein
LTLQFDAKPIFAGHQTFHPRFGWIKKAYDNAANDPLIFSREDATVRLGVGKNMVEAIRFWGNAFKVITNVQSGESKRATLAVPTNFGTAIFAENGYDTFAENPATLWLLHWFGNTAPSSLPIWRCFVNEFQVVEFTTSELENFCEEQIIGTPWKNPARASIEKDVDCIIRMYSSRDARGRQTIDDLMDSPFRQLGLLSTSPASDESYRFVIGDKPFLSDLLIAFFCIDFIAVNDPNSKTVTTTRLSSDGGSPGRLLKIPESKLLGALENVCTQINSLTIASPAGASQLILNKPPQAIATQLLNRIYKESKKSVPTCPTVGPEARDPFSPQTISKKRIAS